jgi:hypothetical protein
MGIVQRFAQHINYMQYTPIQPNETPTLGKSGQAVIDLQKSLNAKNIGTPGYVPLKVDGLYGPLTEKANTAGQTIQNTSSYRKNTTSNMNEFDTYFNPDTVTSRAETTSKEYGSDVDRINSELSNYRSGLSANTSKLIDSISTQFAIRKGQQEQVTKGQTAGITASGYRSGANQVLQNYQGALISETERAGISKLAELDAEQAKLTSEAEIARLDKDYKAFNDAMDNLRAIRKEKTSTVNDIYKESLNYTKNLQEMELDRKKYELDVIKAGKGSGSGNSKTDWNKVDASLRSGGQFGETIYNGIGEDDKVDPYLYLELYNSLSLADRQTLVKKYPPEKFINKESYNLLPASIIPKKSSTSRTS